MEDRELIRRIQSGHKELLHDVIKKYYDDILHFCMYQIHDVTYAYDITQETFYRFIRCAETYQYRNLKGYLITIARNLCVDYWNGKIVTLDIDEQEAMGRIDSDLKNTQLEQVEDRMVLAELLAKLPVEQREVIVMRYYSDLKLSEIARILEVKLSTVKSRIRLGVESLKRIGGGNGYGNEYRRKE